MIASRLCCQQQWTTMSVGRQQPHARGRMMPPHALNSEYSRQNQHQKEGTGRWVATGLLIAVLASTPSPTMAMEDGSSPGNSNTNPYIEELLRKSESKREERRKERLQDYYRRNFTDYFTFETSPGMSQQGLSPETSNQMKQWLKDNTQ
ncbi:hypothetical protein M9435_004246 [Picochlorum sp. BPE23]|nr:hypothetical protein M9435_004246 [Picochlorum sp. BPE23]